MTIDFSRRGILAAIGLSAAPPVAATVSVASAVVPPALILPPALLIPETYFAEMTAIGWRPVAMLMRGVVRHVIEYGPEDPTEMYDSWEGFRLIQKRVPKGAESKVFWLSTAHYLNDMGLFEEVSRR